MASAAGIVLAAGCAGRGVTIIAAHGEFGYLASGTNIVQFTVLSTGQLSELIPNTAPSTNAVAITVTANTKFAYAANKGPGTISQYSIGTTATLTPLVPSTVAAGSAPDAIVSTPDSKFVYALNHNDSTISEYSIGATGQLTPLLPATVAVAGDGDAMTVTPDGKYLYATGYSSGTISAYSIGLDGQLTPLSVPTYFVSSPNSPVVSPNGAYLYVPLSVVGVAQFSIAVDGSLTPLNPATVGAPALGSDAAAVTPNGNFAYVGCFNGGNPGSPVGQYSIGGGGTLTPLVPASVPAGNAPYSIAIDPAGKFAYVTNSNDGTISQFSIGVDGTLTALNPGTINPNGAFQMVFMTR